MEFLQAMLEHRSVNLREDLRSDLHHVIWADAHDVCVKGSVMDLAHRHAVVHRRLTFVPVWDDVGGIKELFVAQTAHGAATSIGTENTAAKLGLMKSND